ncbi:MAG: hypothetical protein WBB67_01230 [bacterium]
MRLLNDSIRTSKEKIEDKLIGRTAKIKDVETEGSNLLPYFYTQ